MLIRPLVDWRTWRRSKTLWALSAALLLLIILSTPCAKYDLRPHLTLSRCQRPSLTCTLLLTLPPITLLTAVTDPFAIRQVSLGPAKWDRKDPVGHSEEDPWGETA